MSKNIWQPKNVIEALWPIQLLSWLFSLGIIHYPINQSRIGLIQVCVAIELMERRFKKVNQILLNILDRKKNGHHEWSEVPMIMTDVNNPSRISSTSRIHAIDIMRITKQIHLELCCLCNEISRIFGIQIATGLASSFIIVTLLTFTLYIIMVNSSSNKTEKISSAIILILWLVGNYLKIFHINKISANTITEWKKTGGIIHELEIACKDNEYRDDVRQFSLQILQNPLSFNACGLVTLGYNLVHGRFKKINKLLLDCVEEKKSGEKMNRKWPPAQLFFNVSGKFHGHIPTSQDSTNDILRIAKRLHLELCGLCGEFSKIYGIQIAIILAESIVSVVGFIFSFYTIMAISKMNTEAKIFRVIFLIIRLSSIYLSVCVANISSANTIMEWEKTGRILHELEIVSNNKEHRRQICQFSLQIIQNPLSFTACGLISLGYDFLHGFVGSVTTYAIILIQMYHAPQK
ncbi:hypothetical protein PV328_005160 [Microctonus aethiopoides]|uniref:Gustatory receptor n=1 Tax=Microctonus aethiopoides TaxID=144406 RepID=A0AA39FLR8_9HYME|nr:hypothetical protein PV328_005160 [Microctonus aethiopoides]